MIVQGIDMIFIGVDIVSQADCESHSDQDCICQWMVHIRNCGSCCWMPQTVSRISWSYSLLNHAWTCTSDTQRVDYPRHCCRLLLNLLQVVAIYVRLLHDERSVAISFVKCNGHVNGQWAMHESSVALKLCFLKSFYFSFKSLWMAYLSTIPLWDFVTSPRNVMTCLCKFGSKRFLHHFHSIAM